MRLTVLILITIFMQVSASSYGQRITINQQDSPIKSILKEIRRQSGYSFFYDGKIISENQKASLNVTNVSVDEALNSVLTGLNLSYTINGKIVSIKKKVDLSFIERGSYQLQVINVHGKIIDENGRPLTGASVKVKGLDKSTNTNQLGLFFLAGVNENATLIISYVGYRTVERAAKSTVNVSMEPESAVLEEIAISTGYQRIQKDQLTGAASTIGAATYHQREAVTGNFLESLEGKVPGLVYNGQTADLSIRGVSTFDAVKQPLIVLDGFPTEIDLRTINPNDILSVSVLRDAAAASIYGVRASNGVIVVETRRGKSGKPVFNLNTSLATQSSPDFNYLNYARAKEFVQLQREHFYSAQQPPSLYYDLAIFKMNPALEILFKGPRAGVNNPFLSQAQVDQELIKLGSYDNLNDYKRLFYRSSQVQNVNLDVTGGNDINTYFIGLNYINENLVNRGSDNKQINLNLANTVKFTKNINFDFKGTYTSSNKSNATTPGYGEFFPYERLTDEVGDALPVALGPGRDFITTAVSNTTNRAFMEAGLYDSFYYPYKELNGTTNSFISTAARFQGRLNARILNWLSADIGGNYEQQSVLSERLQTEDSFQLRRLTNSMALREPATGKALFSNMPKGNILKRNTEKLINYTLRGQLNFNHNVENGNHSLSGIIGLEQRKSTSDAFMTSFFGYDGQTLIVKPINMSALNATTTPAFPVSLFASLTPTRFSSNDYFSESSADRRFMSYYGQGTYIFKSKYVATGSFRIDQSNLFGVDPKYKNTPLWSAGLNWRLGEEDFLRQHAWIDQLQLRAAIGFNGNIPSSNNGSFLILNTALNTRLNTPLVYNEVLVPENQSLRWETTKNYNFGADYSFANGKFSGSVEYYIKNTKDVFGQFDSDPTTGFNQYNANTASIQNKGWEIVFNSLNLAKNKLEWRTQVTTSFNENKVLAVKATEYVNTWNIVTGTAPEKGRPIGAIYSYNYGGVTSSGEPYALDRAGNQRVFKSNSTLKVDVTREDLIYSGTTTPKYILGLNNQFRFGDFDLSVLLMYYGGHVMRVEPPDPNEYFLSNVPLKGSLDYWRRPGDEEKTNVPGFFGWPSGTQVYETVALNAYRYAAQFVRKADYIRLRDVVLTYRAKARFLERNGLSNVQLRLQAQNPLRYTFSGNDIDPDAIYRLTGERLLERQPIYSLTFSSNF